jgi:biotin transport system substrate-specific component
MIPLPFTPVPINLAMLAVFLAGGLLGPKYGTLSQAIFVLLGAIGLPVFAGFEGGLGALVGPTGGYIFGYIAAAFVVGLITGKSNRPNFLRLILAMIAGIFICYALGTIWFIISTGTGLVASLMMCIVPFLIGDALKIIAAVLLVRILKRFVPK